MPGKIAEELENRAIFLVKQGLYRAQVSRETGLHEATISRIVHRNNLTIRKASQGFTNPDYREIVQDMKPMAAVEYLLNALDVLTREPPELKEEFLKYHFTKSEERIFFALFKVYKQLGLGAVLNQNKLLDILYFDRPNEESDIRIVRVFVTRIRGKLKNSPYCITSDYKGGYYLCRKDEL